MNESFRPGLWTESFDSLRRPDSKECFVYKSDIPTSLELSVNNDLENTAQVTHTTFMVLFVVFGAWQPQFLHSLFILHLCVSKWKPYRFGTTWGWVNDDRMFIFGWLSLNFSLKLFKCFITTNLHTLFKGVILAIERSLLCSPRLHLFDKK